MCIINTKILNKNDIRITISERFDFSSHKLFREAYTPHQTKETLFRIDLSDANYMDSSALGMLLLLKEHADSLAGSIVIEHPNISINKILKIAKFDDLMEIIR